ncbi:MmcQ/YjbR family DNA-binding protein [Cellulomonas xiejunii]|uniref:MmcQ/YjbR family DNA-binding protein n=1 Tax=Cellulomonas xiejunii TaxID=2968083 RepID=A0ABY5KMS4_9CELL|nr:MmcQ/YjbR family DNA-binding protein [Cellulomonas xiejunii]MCC2315856.1 MmcQ/YjbR family DNA-binding protein [Cellulomonas xiejunii]MCC2320793.1 MmcQ/YjbR family DNA-binding protein [Cellulomonas xiejunii]UUI71079.1 MmcQ/YjbR family DNA-binding protein [Cellulomonas xiejunii]
MGTSWTLDDAEAARTRLAEVVAPLPEVSVELRSEHGHSAVLLGGRRFAGLTVDHHDDGRLALRIGTTPEEQRDLVAQDPARFFVPDYDGAHGWVGMLVDPASDPDWEHAAELLESAWRRRAPKRALRALDERRAGDDGPSAL